MVVATWGEHYASVKWQLEDCLLTDDFSKTLEEWFRTGLVTAGKAPAEINSTVYRTWVGAQEPGIKCVNVDLDKIDVNLAGYLRSISRPVLESGDQVRMGFVSRLQNKKRIELGTCFKPSSS